MRIHVVGDSISLHYGPYLQRYLEGEDAGAAGAGGAASAGRGRGERAAASAGAASPAQVRRFAYSRKRDEDGASSADLDHPLAGPGAHITGAGTGAGHGASTSANAGDSDMVVAYLEARLSTLEADVLLVNCGLHDIKRTAALEAGAPGAAGAAGAAGLLGAGVRQPAGLQVPEARYRANLERIVELTADAAKGLVWLTTTPVVDEVHLRSWPGFDRYAVDLERYNAVASAVMTAGGVPVIDLHGFTLRLAAAEPSALYCDHVHFNDDVRALQAAFIAGWLEGQARY